MTIRTLLTARSTLVSRLGQVARFLAVAAVAIVAFGVAASATDEVGPLTVRAALRPSLSGTTALELPPLGRITADTHVAPVAASATLVAVDFDGLQDVAAAGLPTVAQIAGWRAALTNLLLLAATRGVIAALLAAGLAAAAVWRSRGPVVRAVVGAAGTVGIVALLFILTFSLEAFRQPRFEGALSHAPALLAMAEQRADTVTGLQRQLSSLAANLAAYYAVPQSYESAGSLAGTLRVLHVSDRHLDPVGMQLSLDLARAYDVGLVIDTGDLSHFGTLAEAAAASVQIGSLPLVFVPGNHDSPTLVSELAALPNATVLDGDTTLTALGLVVAGVGDPAGLGTDVEPDPEAASDAGRALARSLDAAGMRPDIVAVHDPASGAWFEGLTPLVLSGHTHTPALEERGGTWFLGAGTTGGVHFSELRSDPHIPHSAAILYYEPGSPPRLVAIDQIEVYGKTRRSSVVRTLVEPGPAGD